MVNSLQQSVQVPQRLSDGVIPVHSPLRALQASVCSSRLDGAILNIATYPVEHSVSYSIFALPVLPSLDDILHVGRAAGLWRAIHGLHARQKIVAFPLI